MGEVLRAYEHQCTAELRASFISLGTSSRRLLGLSGVAAPPPVGPAAALDGFAGRLVLSTKTLFPSSIVLGLDLAPILDVAVSVTALFAANKALSIAAADELFDVEAAMSQSLVLLGDVQWARRTGPMIVAKVLFQQLQVLCSHV